jgi:hypothetical protein
MVMQELFPDRRDDSVKDLGDYRPDITGDALMVLALERLGFLPEAEQVRKLIAEDSYALDLLAGEFISAGGPAAVAALAMDFGVNCIGLTKEKMVSVAHSMAEARIRQRDKKSGWG